MTEYASGNNKADGTEPIANVRIQVTRSDVVELFEEYGVGV